MWFVISRPALLNTFLLVISVRASTSRPASPQKLRGFSLLLFSFFFAARIQPVPLLAVAVCTGFLGGGGREFWVLKGDSTPDRSGRFVFPNCRGPMGREILFFHGLHGIVQPDSRATLILLKKGFQSKSTWSSSHIL